MSRESDRDRMNREAVKADRKKYESGKAYDRGVAERTRKAIEEDRKKSN